MDKSTEELSWYPDSLAMAIQERWADHQLRSELLPAQRLLIQFVDGVYQASLLREEGEGIQFRAVLAAAETFEHAYRDGTGALQVIRFQDPIEATPHNFRKLAAAADFYRSILGVAVANDKLEIWGTIYTGTNWVNNVQGGKPLGPPLPQNLLLQLVGPGHLIVMSGHLRILESASGKLLTDGFDPFRSEWLPQHFASIRESLLQELGLAKRPGCRICDAFVKDVAQNVVRRVLRFVRTRGHGGVLVYLPEGSAEGNLTDRWFRFRVRCVPDDSTQRFRRLMLSLIRRAIDVGEPLGLAVVTWDDYQEMHDAELAEIDAAFVEFSHVLSDLMNIDGCLVIDRGFRLIGYGAEILGDSHVDSVRRALDLECSTSVSERADSAGTRHRSAYRLVQGWAEAIAIVVSQDGDVRFVAQHEGGVAYWPYLP